MYACINPPNKIQAILIHPSTASKKINTRSRQKSKIQIINKLHCQYQNIYRPGQQMTKKRNKRDKANKKTQNQKQ